MLKFFWDLASLNEVGSLHTVTVVPFCIDAGHFRQAENTCCLVSCSALAVSSSHYMSSNGNRRSAATANSQTLCLILGLCSATTALVFISIELQDARAAAAAGLVAELKGIQAEFSPSSVGSKQQATYAPSLVRQQKVALAIWHALLNVLRLQLSDRTTNHNQVGFVCQKSIGMPTTVHQCVHTSQSYQMRAAGVFC